MWQCTCSILFGMKGEVAARAKKPEDQTEVYHILWSTYQLRNRAMGQSLRIE